METSKFLIKKNLIYVIVKIYFILNLIIIMKMKVFIFETIFNIN